MWSHAARSLWAGYNKRMVSTLLPVLQTPRLILRPMTVGDTDAVYRMICVSRDSFSRWFTWAREATPDSVREYNRQMEEAMTVGRAWQYVILTRAHSLVGRVGLTDLDPVTRCAELGYLLRTDFEGQGLMTEAVRELAAHALGPGGTAPSHGVCGCGQPRQPARFVPAGLSAGGDGAAHDPSRGARLAGSPFLRAAGRGTGRVRD